MSFEDLKEARIKRAVKEAAIETKGKGKRGRKPKSAGPEADEASADNVKPSQKRKSPAPEAEEATADKGKCDRKRKSPASEADALEPKAKVARMIGSSEPWKTPVAQMLAKGTDERSAGCRR